MTSIDIVALSKQLSEFGQNHLIQFWNDLSATEQEALHRQIAGIDFGLIRDLLSHGKEKQEWAEIARNAEPPQAIRLNQDVPFALDQAALVGERALRDGKVAMVLVAGGQGTRLGFDLPKGMFPLGPVSKRTLFQIHFEKVLATGRHFGTAVPLLVMTSPATHGASVDFIKHNQRFGVAEKDFRIFCQGTMPAADAETGRLLLASKGELFAAPDGHGGTVAALEKHQCLDWMRERGIEYVYYCQVDNPMALILDPLTIGYHILAESEMTSQTCPKRYAKQKVGNFVSLNGKVQIIEYSDLPDEIAEQTDEHGNLKFWAGSIAVHVFNLSFLSRMTSLANSLPFHIAHKKVPFIDTNGQRVEPEKPNAFKFERFIFDLLPQANNALLVEVDPEQAFAPVKNGFDALTDTPETAQMAMIRQAQRWLREAGVQIDDGIAVEISPLYALSARELAAKRQIPQAVDTPTYFR
ncbi:MAG TPA: UDPGP type 1 family protein [Pirellulaceae bacterium]|nr:UDPGP type 1 family protein [Pirellulaceae bacterium]HMO92940.1 UDPGP type 1 family protein [Pirellulaceae bacterium]HMP68495.1 UDPGP type 1 family protein [Pirellulaceae bacterium]